MATSPTDASPGKAAPMADPRGSRKKSARPPRLYLASKPRAHRAESGSGTASGAASRPSASRERDRTTTSGSRAGTVVELDVGSVTSAGARPVSIAAPEGALDVAPDER